MSVTTAGRTGLLDSFFAYKGSDRITEWRGDTMYRILELNPQLKPFEQDINLRMELYRSTKQRLLGQGAKLKTIPQ